MPPRRALREKPRASQSVQSLNHGNGIKEEKLGGDVGGADLNKKARIHGDIAENVKTYRTKRKRGRPRKSSTMDDDDEEDDDDDDEDEDDDDDDLEDDHEDEADDKEDQGEVSDSRKEKILRQKGHENRRKEEAKDHLHLHSSISKEEESVMHSNQTNGGHIHQIKNHNNKRSYGNGNGNDKNHQNNENDEDNKNPNNKSKFRKKKKESSKSSPEAPGKERDGVSRSKSVDLPHKVSTNIHLAIPLLKSSIGSKRMRRRKGHPSRAAEACL